MERVSGNPLNPGVEWRNWPWSASADKFRLDPRTLKDPGPERIFDHTYAMRYWPKWAGRYSGGVLPQGKQLAMPRRGIYFDYGDLDDVVSELVKEPTTRQAILPVWHPEDTGWRINRRKPCSISYHFMINSNNGLDIFYHLRSCDIVHHFRDDIYLTVRLLLWVLDRARRIDPWWNSVAPGDYVMYIGNLHCFVNDWRRLNDKG
jgi:thymidylate synthase